MQIVLAEPGRLDLDRRLRWPQAAKLTRGPHARVRCLQRRCRGGLDMRWTNVYNENYNNAGGLVQFNRSFTRSTINSTNELEGNAFAAFLLGKEDVAVYDGSWAEWGNRDDTPVER